PGRRRHGRLAVDEDVALGAAGDRREAATLDLLADRAVHLAAAGEPAVVVEVVPEQCEGLVAQSLGVAEVLVDQARAGLLEIAVLVLDARQAAGELPTEVDDRDD